MIKEKAENGVKRHLRRAKNRKGKAGGGGGGESIKYV